MNVHNTALNCSRRAPSQASRSSLVLALLASLFVATAVHSEEVSLADLPGRKIDANWFRYTNMRFGLAIDIPMRGYRYDVPVNGSGLSLISKDERVTITIHTHLVMTGLFGAEEEQAYDICVRPHLQSEGKGSRFKRAHHAPVAFLAIDLPRAIDRAAAHKTRRPSREGRRKFSAP